MIGAQIVYFEGYRKPREGDELTGYSTGPRESVYRVRDLPAIEAGLKAFVFERVARTTVKRSTSSV